MEKIETLARALCSVMGRNADDGLYAGSGDDKRLVYGKWHEVVRNHLPEFVKLLSDGGLVIVPKKPTDEMVDAALEGYDEDEKPTVRADYASMISAYRNFTA